MQPTNTLLIATAALGVFAGSQTTEAVLFSGNGTPLPGQTITIDGDMSDWTTGPTNNTIVTTDPDEDAVEDQYDLNNLYFANDETTLYGRFQVVGAFGDGTGVSQSTNSNRRVYYIFDLDNNRDTGFTYDRDFPDGTVSDGNEAELRLHLAAHETDGQPGSNQFDNQLYRDIDPTVGAPQEQVDSNVALNTDELTGSEWSISLDDLGIPSTPGTYTVSYYAFQNFNGDLVRGNTWNDQSPTFDSFQITVVPEPASLGLLGLGGLAMLGRRRRRR